jgi:hypothetical protein
MKRFFAAVLLAAVVALAHPVYAGHFWQVTISTPKTVLNSRNFNIEYTTLSVESGDTFAVELFQNGVSAGTKNTTEAHGDSGAFNVTVPADGNYEYKVVARNNGEEVEEKSAGPVNVTVDTVAPGAPVYQGAVRDGNSYAVTFTAPADGDVVRVVIYSSSSTTFTADSTTQVGSVLVSPGETKVFVYTAGDSARRFHALQAFDGAGNFSSLVGDSNVTVTQGTLGSGGGSGAGTGTGGGASASSGDVAGGAQTGGEDGQNGDVLSDDEDGDDGGGNILWILLSIGAIALLWTLLRRRGGNSDTQV